jgi:two-component system response regulator CpxR
MSVAILLVDDDVKLCALMAEFLGGHGYALSYANDGVSGMVRAVDGRYDLIILDVMLPPIDGFEVLRRLRLRTTVPVIMLTARASEADRISGLEGGADDYLLKPFAANELLARIRAVLRRVHQQKPVPPSVLAVGRVRLNVHTYEAWTGNTALDLTPTEFEILELLMRSAGRVVSRDDIAGLLYQREATAYERSVDVHLSHLRKKLDKDAAAVIRTVRGVGYVFSATD